MRELPPLGDIPDHLDATAFTGLNSLVFLNRSVDDLRYSNRWVIAEAIFGVHRHTP